MLYKNQEALTTQYSDHCFICGAIHAAWFLNSKPGNEGDPYFPFLQYQNTPNATARLDAHGRALVCNVCYLFLTQQWKTYQLSGTPPVKRIYWLKRSNNEYGQEFSQEQEFNESYQQNYGNVEKEKEMFNKSSFLEKVKEETCNICFVIQPCELLTFAYTQPQHSIDIPFYPGIPTEFDDGRFLVCKTCHSYLYHQWMEYETNHISHSNRKYRTVNQNLRLEEKHVTTETYHCYLCDENMLQNNVKTFCKYIPEQPYFPFLKNIKKSKHCLPISKDGYTFCCTDCNFFLKNQWSRFEKIGTPQIERVYRININQTPFVPTEVCNKKELSCYICNKKKIGESCKRIYCNSGANLNLGFLKTFHCNDDAYYSQQTGETFICLTCFEELHQHWLNYRSNLFGTVQSIKPVVIKKEVIKNNDAMFNKTNLQTKMMISSESNAHPINSDINDNTMQNSISMTTSKNKTDLPQKIECKTKSLKVFDGLDEISEMKGKNYDYRDEKCQICSAVASSPIPLKVNPVNDFEPFFPIIKKYLLASRTTTVRSCQVCAIHLLTQWGDQSNVNVSERKYNLHKFQCSKCKEEVCRSKINLIASIKMDGYDKQVTNISDDNIFICKLCQQSLPENKLNKRALSESKDCEEGSLDQQQQSETDSLEEDINESLNADSGMKATAKVSPFTNFNMRSHTQEHPTSTLSNSNNNDEVSFAAALRKLAQQTPTPHGQQNMFNNRDRRINSPPNSKAGGGDGMMFLQHHGRSHDHPRSHDMHIGGPPSIMAPVIPPSPIHSEAMITPRDSRDKRKEMPSMSMFQFREQEEMSHRRSQEEISHRRSQERNHIERHSSHHSGGFDDHHLTTSGITAANILSNNPFKERSSSSIGLVHPQPVQRKIHEDKEASQSSAMNSMHYPPRDSVPPMHSLSPSEMSRFAPFSLPSHQQQHPHGAQSSTCPVHGHEREHQHDERNSRPPPPGLQFDLPSHFPRDLHSLHGQHPRLREELQFLHGRHHVERKEHLPSHQAFEEDLRRRGVDYRWAGLPPHLLDEQYRRHLLNNGHEPPHPSAPFKEAHHQSGKMFAPPFYYGSGGREHPLHVDPFLPSPHGLPPGDLHHRHQPPVSPRLLDYYRREHAERSRHAEFGHERRHSDERKELQLDIHRKSIDLIKRKQEEDQRKFNPVQMHERNHIEALTPHHHSEKKVPIVPIFKGLDYHLKNNKANEVNTHQINSIIHAKLPDPKIELAAASILANMNRMNQSPCSDEVESLTSSSGPDNLHLKQVKIEPVETNDEHQCSEEKENYMLTLGLVSQPRKRALEDEYERARWERKFRKFRGRPKKRSRRENTDEGSLNGDHRSSSELDFYNGPMTRHKQQLLQEQENLLEQIQKRNSVDEINDENANVIKTSKENSINDRIKTRKSPRNSPNKNTNSSIDTKTNIIDTNENSSSNSEKHSENIPLETFSRGSPSQSMQKDIDQSRLLHALRDKQHASSIQEHASSIQEQIENQKQLQQQHIDQQRHLQKHSINDHNKRPTSSPMDLKQQLHQKSNMQHPFDLPKHPMELTKHFNGRHPMEFHEDIKTLDNSLFGRCMDGNSDSFARWPGVEPLAHAYTAYMAEHDIQRQHVLQSFEELQREGRCLHQKREYLEKDMVVYNERRIHIAEKRREMRLHMETIHRALRTMSSL